VKNSPSAIHYSTGSVNRVSVKTAIVVFASMIALAGGMILIARH
jgi:hypothetical protein